MSNIRLIIADDSRLFREGLRQICEQSGYEVAEIGTGQNLMESACRIKPDVILMDAVQNNVRIISDLAGNLPKTKIILLTSSFQDEAVFEAIKAGAYGCLPRNICARELTERIYAAYSEEPWIFPDIADKMIKEFSRSSLRVDLTKNAERLTHEEMEVLGMIADGLGKKTAADRIRKSEEAVTEILNGVIRKLRANLDIFE